MRPPRALTALCLFAAIGAAACGSSSAKSGSGPVTSGDSQNPDANQLQAIVASFDLAVGPPARFIVQVQMGDGRLVGYGTIRMSVHQQNQNAPSQVAQFLPIPGTKPPSPIPPQPQLVHAVQGRGVYGATVHLTSPGLWVADVQADVKDVGTMRASTTFQVNPTHTAVTIGEKAPASNNLTLANHGHLPLSAVDSRAQGKAPVPDPQLHQHTIAAALATHQPIVIVVSTPVYCVSRFCGPTTDLVESTAKRDAGKAVFIHLEIWANYNNQQLNEAAAQWIARGPGDANEPWVFVVGRDGIVKARFDNVVTPAELDDAIARYAS
jgi:hypothetical protein